MRARWRDVRQLGEQLGVALGVGCVWAGVARGVHAGSAVERVDTQPGVIAEGRLADQPRQGGRLLGGVAAEVRCVLDDVDRFGCVTLVAQPVAERP